MSLLSRLGLMTKKEARAWKSALYGNLPDWLLQTASAEKWQQPDPQVYGNQADLYRKLSCVMLAIDITASASAVTKFNVARQVAEKEPKDIPNHPFELLLQHPNELDSRYEFLYATVAMYKLTGNAYWWMNRANPDAQPEELWLIPSHKIRVEPDGNLYIKAYWYDPGNGREIPLEPWEIVHFRRFNPFSRFVGLSAIEAIAMSAQGVMGMEEWNTKLFKEHGGALPGILAFKEQREKPVWDQIKADVRDAESKKKMLMLQGVGDGVNWLQNSVSQKEMEFLGGLSASNKQIMDALAPGLYTWLSGESTYANAGANRAAFNELTLYPMHNMMGEKITNQVLTTYAKNSPSPERTLVGQFEDVRFADKEMKLREIEAYSKTHTLNKINEVYYKSDEKFDDERGDLLPSQINASSGGLQEPPPPPQGEKPLEMEEKEMKPEEQKPAEPKEEPNKAALDDLAKWQRKAMKKIGAKVDFASENIPSDVVANIAEALPTCKTEAAIKAVFDQARQELKPKGNEAAIVLQGLLEALKKA